MYDNMKKIVISILLSFLITEIKCAYTASDDCWSKHSQLGEFEW